MTKISKLINKTKVETAVNYKRAHNSHRAECLKVKTSEVFLVSSLKLFHKDME